MRKIRFVSPATLAAFTLLACGASALSPSTRGSVTPLPSVATPAAPVASATLAEPAPSAALPAAPWTDAPLSPQEVPPSLLAAWRRADNRAWCAPVAPRALRGDMDARLRRGTKVDGGWSVEFDRAGAPGLAPDGHSCPRCGRGTFGIVGAALTPDEAFGPELVALSFQDGSRMTIERPAAEGEPASATLAIAGQGCVYQVWSFLGEEHLRGLIDALRFVETGRETVAMDE